MIFSPLLATLLNAMLGWALFFLSLFLVLLILVQRGRGGGLTGALGGPGGQSAFGTKAGDLFTRITSFVALGWIALCAFTMWSIGSHAPSVAVDPTPLITPSPADQRSSTTTPIDLDGTTGDGAATGDENAPAGDLVPAEELIESSEAPESAGDDAQSVDAEAETTQSETDSEAVDEAVSAEGTTTPEPGDIENR
jgi:preprotein translocase subunit SecG